MSVLLIQRFNIQTAHSKGYPAQIMINSTIRFEYLDIEQCDDDVNEFKAALFVLNQSSPTYLF